ARSRFSLRLAIRKFIGAPGDAVELTFDLLPSGFERSIVRVAPNVDRLPADNPHVTERQIDGSAIPAVELEAAARCHRYCVNGPAGMLRELHNSHPGDARHL